jgi:hypothetical protein
MENSRPPKRPPLVMMLVFGVFGCIGLAMFVSIWAVSSNSFGAPPLPVRLVGSFIALAFIILGIGVPISAWKRAREASDSDAGSGRQESSSTPAAGYRCPHCGAGLGNQEVSPSGDVKCAYCKVWWNIHRRPR